MWLIINKSKVHNERTIKFIISVEWSDEYVWIYLNLNIISGTSSLKLLLLEAFIDRVHDEGLHKGFEDLFISLHSHEMMIGLATSMDRSFYKKSRKV